MEIYDKNKELCIPNGTNILKYIEKNKCKECKFYCTSACLPNTHYRTNAIDDNLYHVLECFKQKEDDNE